MNKSKIIEILNCLGSDVASVQNRTGWVIAHCPLAPWEHGGVDKNPSFGVREESGDNFCNCWSCGFHGDMSKLVAEFHIRNKMKHAGTYDIKRAQELVSTALDDLDLDFDQPDFEETLLTKKKDIVEFPDWYLSSFPKANQFQWVCNYLHQRGVPESLWDVFDLRADSNQMRVCLPVRDFKNRFVGLHGRDATDQNPLRYRMYTYAKMSNPLVWYGEHYVDFDKPVVTVEGYFDLLSVYRVYRNVVSPLFANPSFDKMKRMSDVEHFVTLYDHGKGGDTGRSKIDAFAQGREVTHLVPPEGKKDPGVMTVEELQEVLGKVVALDAPILA